MTLFNFSTLQGNKCFGCWRKEGIRVFDTPHNVRQIAVNTEMQVGMQSGESERERDISFTGGDRR